MDLDALVGKDAPYLLLDIDILLTHELRPGLYDRHIAADPAISLRQFEARVASPDHDQMRGQIIELERLDVSKRQGFCQAGSAGNGGLRSDVEKDLVGRECARSGAVCAHFKRLRRY